MANYFTAIYYLILMPWSSWAMSRAAKSHSEIALNCETAEWHCHQDSDLQFRAICQEICQEQLTGRWTSGEVESASEISSGTPI